MWRSSDCCQNYESAVRGSAQQLASSNCALKRQWRRLREYSASPRFVQLFFDLEIRLTRIRELGSAAALKHSVTWVTPADLPQISLPVVIWKSVVIVLASLAILPESLPARRRAVGKGARFLRGVANPCPRAPA